MKPVRRRPGLRWANRSVMFFGIMIGGIESAQAAWTVTLLNRTGQTLTYYEVNLTPPPQRVSAGTVAHGATFSIDPDGFNPVFAFDDGISLTGTDPNGFFIGLGLTGTPPAIQFKLFHYKVAPGTAGAVASRQPIELMNRVVEVSPEDVLIIVGSDWNATIGAPPPNSACCVDTACSEVASAAECAGTFLMGEMCSSAPCEPMTSTVGPAGGTVTSPDGTVSVEFPPGCLDSETEVTIREGDWPSRMFDIDLGPLAGADFDVHFSFFFEPNTLEFCEEAELCFSFERAGLGLDPADCDDLNILHREKICVAGNAELLDTECTTDGECGFEGDCEFRFHSHLTTCTCPAASSSGSCCANIEHFSTLGLVNPIRLTIPTFPWWWAAVLPIIIFLLAVIFRSLRRANR